MVNTGFVRRWAKFSAVGATGIAVQVTTLALLLRFAGIHYLVATAIAVEASVLHNFVWHSRWTWADRRGDKKFEKLLRFNLTTGAVSIGANLLLMAVLVSAAGLGALVANIVTIAICACINFALSDRFVFV
jgi:putative flippase GtrA